ncbi:MAG: hypothetical protein OEW52_08645 [Thermoleophilia bacterium]|nr:hypothetical protein [Thermoleophilia bacterium]MDH4341367.1 hypothetical protein [Thermoleophilia bacterium]MDH5281200.1 hypothetical protein [Thermoleophilia bacterium]
MRRLLAVALLLALAGAGAAVAGRGDPQTRFTAADQARAKAMLLRKGDFGLGFRATPTSTAGADFYCKALDESDLTITGEGESPTFVGGVEFVTSLSQVYKTLSHSKTAWRRGTSAAGEKCARDEFRRQFKKEGARLEAFRRVTFPRLAEQSVAYRLVISSQGIRVFIDVIALRQSRIQAGLFLGSALTPMQESEVLRLSRLVARRMAQAKRGS